MAPSVLHPAGVAFVDDERADKHIHVDAATYYGGGESFTRSRTYSHVRLCSQLVIHLNAL